MDNTNEKLIAHGPCARTAPRAGLPETPGGPSPVHPTRLVRRAPRRAGPACAPEAARRAAKESASKAKPGRGPDGGLGNLVESRRRPTRCGPAAQGGHWTEAATSRAGRSGRALARLEAACWSRSWIARVCPLSPSLPLSLPLSLSLSPSLSLGASPVRPRRLSGRGTRLTQHAKRRRRAAQQVSRAHRLGRRLGSEASRAVAGSEADTRNHATAGGRGRGVCGGAPAWPLCGGPTP